MLSIQSYKSFLGKTIPFLSAEELNGTAGLVQGYGGVRYTIAETEFESLGIRQGLNSKTASDIFNNSVGIICRKMIEHNSPLTDEMIDTGFASMIDRLNSCKGDYLFSFFGRGTIFKLAEPLKIGLVSVRNFTEEDMIQFGEKTSAIQLRSESKEDRSFLLKQLAERALFEVKFSGYHLDSELSAPCDSAWKQIQHAAAFLLVCKEMLGLFETSEYLAFHFGTNFMAKKIGQESLNPILFNGSSPSLHELELVIDSDVKKRLENICFLSAFNALASSSGELRDKVFRSLDWFLKGYTESNPTDKLVCFFISLESLISMGGDALSSQTDNLGEAIALLIHTDMDKRVKEKAFFKGRVYKLRNRIMHHGHIFDAEDIEVSERLLEYITQCLIGILKHLDAINESGGLRAFFERAKLSVKF